MRTCRKTGCPNRLIHNNTSGFCKEHRHEYWQQWYAVNKTRKCKESRVYRNSNPENTKQAVKQWETNNTDKLRARKRNYVRNRRKNDMQFKLAAALRTRLTSAIKNYKKTGSAVKDLGCSMDDLRKHLESQFQPGMTWDNYGKGGWEIDHIKPLSQFNLSDTAQLLAACHYTNLQPLWKKDNARKGGK